MELMPVIPAVRNIIREGKSHQIPNAIMSGSQYGMQSMDMALRNLYQQGLITYEDAVAKSTSAEEFNRLIAG
jgi:twitching motility protein PilT